MATNFLDAAGTNGFLTSLFNLMTTELNTLGIGATATSSVGGTSGVFTQTNFANAQKTFVVFTSGGAFTPTAGSGAVLAGWWLMSDDGGTHFEKTVASTALPRPPDFYIPLFASAYASGDRAWSPVTRAPWPSCKIFVLNSAGVALPASGNTLQAATVAEQY